jgi:Ca-activated chloride channel family protein
MEDPMRPRLLLLLSAFALSSGISHGQGIVRTDPATQVDTRGDSTAGRAAEPAAAGRKRKTASPLTLPVSSIRIAADIEGQLATVKVEHVFRNDTEYPLEGTYYFPVPEGATLVEFAVWDGDIRRVGRVMEKTDARVAYSSAVAQQEDPALLELTRRGWFQSRISFVGPHSEKRVELKYSQLLQDKNGVVTFEYPLGRGYKKLRIPVGNVTIEVGLRSNTVIGNVFSPTHVMDIERVTDYRVTCKAQTVGGGDADNFQLTYSLAAGDIRASLTTYRSPGEDGYFLLLLSPNIDFEQRRISAKETVFVVDVSGSMEGDKLRQAKEALRFGITKTLNPGDAFNIIAFESKVTALSPALLPYDRPNSERALDYIDKLAATGGTNINDALVTAAGMFKSDRRPHNLVFITDGRASEGVTEPELIAANVANANRSRARVFTFGVGNDVNRLLLEKLSAGGRGSDSIIEEQSQLRRTLSSFFAKVSKPVLSDLQIDFGPLIADRVHPGVLPDLYTRSNIKIFGRYRNLEDLRRITISLTGLMNGESQQFDFTDLDFPLITTQQQSLPKLWASEHINALLAEIRLTGETSELRQQVIGLATQFNLVTPYTSMYVPKLADASEEALKHEDEGPAGHSRSDGTKQSAKAPNSKLTVSGDEAGGTTGPNSSRASVRAGSDTQPGAVTDASGAVIVGATVTLRSESGTTRVITTDEHGNYNVSGLPPGRYRVEIDAAGFQHTELTDVPIKAGQTTGAGVDLSVGSSSETVTVVASNASLVDSDSSIGSTEDKDKIKQLPNLAPITSLSRLAPGTLQASADKQAQSVSQTAPEFMLVVPGVRIRSNGFSIDGQDNNGLDGEPAVELKSPDTVESLTVLITRATGDVSPSTASSINIVTRSGTNEFHGSVFDYYLNRRLGALSPMERRNGLQEPLLFKSNLLGGTFGGPIRQDRASFFGAFSRNSQHSIDFVDSTSSMLTPTLRGLGTLSQEFFWSPTLQDLERRGPLVNPNGSVSTTRTFPYAVLGKPVEFGETIRELNSEAGSYEASAKVEFQATRRDRLQGACFLSESSITNGAGRLAAGDAVDQTARGQLGSAHWTRLLSPTATNDVEVGFNRAAASLGSTEAGGSFPSVSTGFLGLSYGSDPFALSRQGSTRIHISDGLSLLVGRHSLKLGGQVARRATSFSFLPGVGGAFEYPGFADFILDRPAAITVASGDPTSSFAEWTGQFYADDSWRMRRNLSVMGGLSYEISNQPANQLAARLRRRESNPQTALFDGSLPLELRAPRKVQLDLDNFAPRLGVAYTPSFRVLGHDLFGPDKTILRGGISVSYDQTAYRTLADLAATSPNVLLGVLTPGKFVVLPSFPQVPDGLLLNAMFGRDPARLARTEISPRFERAASVNWHLGFSRELDRGLTFEVNYVGARGAGLIRAVDGNPQPPVQSSSTGELRVYESSGHSIYHSLQTRADFRLRNSLTGGLSYAFGKALDDVPDNSVWLPGGIGKPIGLAAHGLETFAQNPFDNARGERAVSSFDRKNRLSAHFVWELPLRFHSASLGRFLNGWKASGIAELNSGRAYTPFQYFGLSGTSALFSSVFADRLGALRPFAGNPLAPVDSVAFSNAANNLLHLFWNQDGSLFISPTGFIIADRSGFRSGPVVSARYIYNDHGVEQAAMALGLPSDGLGKTYANGRSYGDVGRNSVIGTRTVNFDLAVFKLTKLTERVSLEIRAEMFNAFNHPNRSIPDSMLEHAGGHGFADLGEVDAAPRRIRIALRLIF